MTNITLPKIILIIRSQEWWETKLSPLLAIAYATVLFSDTPLVNVVFWLLFLLASIIVGAVYVSIINDITDIEEDLASGKENRMADIKPALRWLIPMACAAIGLVCIFFLYPDKLSVLLYILPWISFSLYSFEPVRLKRRGVWGLFADASGSHLFISLLFVSSTSYFTAQPVDWIWFIAVGIWAFSYGLRGILWHQFYDRENDLQVNLTTFATSTAPGLIRNKARILITVELLAFAVMLYRISLVLPILFLGLYFLLVFVRFRWLGYKPVIVITDSERFEIFMLDFYQGFWPLSLLIAAGFKEPSAWIVCLVHILLFPRSLTLAMKDGLRFARKLQRFYFVKQQV